jgi:hypothetical protein
MPDPVRVDDELHDAFIGLIDELVDIERRLQGAEPPLDERERVESYRWIFSVLQVALDAHVWADSGRPRFVDIVGPNKKWGGDNTDAFYKHAPIDPSRTYRVRCAPGDAVYLSLTVYGGPSDGHYSDRIVASANDRTIQRDADGSFDLVLSSEQQPGNWLQLEADAVCAITRDYVDDPAIARRARWTIEADDPPPEKDESIETVAAKFRAARVFLDEQARISPVRVDPPNEVQEPYPVPSATFGWAAGDAAYAMGSFQLGEDEALLVDGRSPECAFWNLCLWNPFLHTFDDAYGRVTINGSQVVANEDGSWRIVVAAKDPGHPNWISTEGHGRGLLWFRWFLPAETPARPVCRVVRS